MKALRGYASRAAAAAAGITGRRFGLLVASSVVATSAIVASALTNPSGGDPLAALLGRSLAADRAAPAAPSAAPAASDPSESTAPSRAPASNASSAGGSTDPIATEAPSAAPAPSTPEDPTETSSTPTTPTPSTPEAGRIKHVFVITLASPGYEASFGSTSQMPYLSGTLRPQGDLLSGYKLLDESTALPNDLAAISGQAPSAETKAGCPSYGKCLFPVEDLTLADQLESARFKWGGYMDAMVDQTGQPGNCVNPGGEEVETLVPGGYSTTRNPFAYFHSLLDLGACGLDDVPLSEMPTALRKVEATPSYSYIAPTPCDAGVIGQCPEGAATGAAAADAFLEQWVPKILASPAYKKDGLLVIAFDQVDPATPTPTPAKPVPPGQVGALLLSRFASPGSTDPAPYDPYSLLRSTEDLFGLTHLGAVGGKKVRSFASPLLGEPESEGE